MAKIYLTLIVVGTLFIVSANALNNSKGRKEAASFNHNITQSSSVVSKTQQERISYFKSAKKLLVDIGAVTIPELVVIDLTGKTVVHKKEFRSPSSINLFNAPKGLYIIKIMQSEKTITRKIKIY